MNVGIFMQNNRTIIWIILGVITICLLLPILGFFACNILVPNPPRPEITYGEFPFRIEYEINGERFVIEDTVICEFDGFGMGAMGDPKIRKWKSRLASGSDDSGLILYVIDDKKIVTFNAGGPKYYMGDSGMSPEEYWRNALKAFLVGEGAALFPEQWYDEYNFRFISWEFTDPIVNTFK